ncbi:MAG: alpha/beta hydrolase-fold protein [Planctomycetota bacterium]
MQSTLTRLALTNVFLCCAVAASQARTWQEGLEGEIDGMSYRYYLPADYDSSKQYPLVLFLHGSGESGTDNDRQVRVHIGGLIDKTESEYPAVLVAPQLPQSNGWSPFQEIDNTAEMLNSLLSTLSVDTDRLYLTGLSMGGFGSMEYVQRYNAEGVSPLKFAAVAPLSGAFIDTSRPGVPESLRDTPIWLAHGSSDTVVSANTSRNTYRILTGQALDAPITFTDTLLGGPTALSGNTRYTELTGRGHNIWSPIYTDDTFYDWMFAQSIAVPEPHTALLALTAMGGWLACRRPRLGTKHKYLCVG